MHASGAHFAMRAYPSIPYWLIKRSNAGNDLRGGDVQQQEIICRERRIKERRRRIQERLQALRQGGSSSQADGEARAQAIGPGLQHVLESTRRVMDLKRETTALVRAVPVDSELAENWRREAEEKRRQGLRAKMLEEAEESARKNAAVAMHWADLFTIDVPQVEHLRLLHLFKCSYLDLTRQQCNHVFIAAGSVGRDAIAEGRL